MGLFLNELIALLGLVFIKHIEKDLSKLSTSLKRFEKYLI